MTFWNTLIEESGVDKTDTKAVLVSLSPPLWVLNNASPPMPFLSTQNYFLELICSKVRQRKLQQQDALHPLYDNNHTSIMYFGPCNQH